MTNQVIIRKTVTETATFLDLPDEGIRRHLLESGFKYDSRTKQWYRSTTDSVMVDAMQAAQIKPAAERPDAFKQAA
jgi:hypothetical protein